MQFNQTHYTFAKFHILTASVSEKLFTLKGGFNLDGIEEEILFFEIYRAQGIVQFFQVAVLFCSLISRNNQTRA